jgi:putative acetyltransferase
MQIRGYDDGDAEATLSVFRRAVRQTARADYSAEQVAAWAPDDLELTAWHQRRRASETLLAVVGDRVAGFTDLDAGGYVDMLFVDPAFARRGVATALISAVVDLAQQRGIATLATYASLTARPFFEREGFVVTEERHPVVRGVVLTNFAMRREL